MGYNKTSALTGVINEIRHLTSLAIQL